jgi:hypothetical protein
MGEAVKPEKEPDWVRYDREHFGIIWAPQPPPENEIERRMREVCDAIKMDMRIAMSDLECQER